MFPLQLRVLGLAVYPFGLKARQTASETGAMRLPLCMPPSPPSTRGGSKSGWQLARKQLLMIVLLGRAGSHLLTPPAALRLLWLSRKDSMWAKAKRQLSRPTSSQKQRPIFPTAASRVKISQGLCLLWDAQINPQTWTLEGRGRS